MNFLHVISGMDPKGGGVAQAVRLYIKGDTSETNVHEVASCDSPDADWLGRDPFPIHALGSGKYGYAYSPRLLPWLIDNLPRFDAVIIHGLWLWPSIATRIALRKLETGKLKAERVTHVSELPPSQDARTTFQLSALKSQVSLTKRPRLFVMPHGMLDPYFQRAPERRIKAIRNWIYWKLIEHRVVNNADGLLFTCEEEMRLAREPFRPYRPKAEKVVGLGTEEPPPYTPAMREALAAACPGLGDQPYILFLGRIHPKKGVNMLIRAYANLKLEIRNLKPETTSQVSALRSHPSAQLPALVIAGPCHDPAYFAKLKAEIGASAHGNARGSLLGKAAQRATLAGAREATLKPETAMQPAAQPGSTGLSGESCGSVGLSPSGEPTKSDSVGKSICEQSQASSVPEDFEAKSLRPHDEKPFCPIPSILSETHRPDHPATPANPVQNQEVTTSQTELTKCSELETPEKYHSANSVNSVENSIFFVDMVSGDAKWGALYGCEAFILPSHQENFGIAVAEALACNKPVLISNKVNIWREIEADGAGLVEDDTDEGTANLLRRFLTEWTKLSESNSHSTDTNSVNSVSKVCFKKRFSIEQAAESLRKTLQNHTF